MLFSFTRSRDDQFALIWDRERPRIWRLTARLSGSIDAADDLTQEVGVRAHAAFPRFRRDAAASTWLYRIAVNVVIRWREQQNAPLEQEVDLEILCSELPTPDHSALHQERIRDVYRALDGLPDELRTPLLLYVWEGMKYREVATVLGLPPGTVMSRIHAARQRLRLALKEWEDEAI